MQSDIPSKDRHLNTQNRLILSVEHSRKSWPSEKEREFNRSFVRVCSVVRCPVFVSEGESVIFSLVGVDEIQVVLPTTEK